jgi:hypothetical protein
MLLYTLIALGALLVAFFLVALARSLKALSGSRDAMVSRAKATRKKRSAAARKRARQRAARDSYGYSKAFPSLNPSEDTASLRRAVHNEDSIDKPWGW